MKVCAECLLPIDDDEAEDDGVEALTIQEGVICDVCAGVAPATGGLA